MDIFTTMLKEDRHLTLEKNKEKKTCFHFLKKSFSIEQRNLTIIKIRQVNTVAFLNCIHLSLKNKTTSHWPLYGTTIDKKAFLRDQCKEIEENNRMEKTRDLFKKIRDTKGTFRVKMGSIKDRNGLDLTEAEDIK